MRRQSVNFPSLWIGFVCFMIVATFEPSRSTHADQPAEKKKGSKISKADQLKLLKLFVSEFVDITPGKGKFPKSYQMGSPPSKADSERPAAEQPAHKVTFDDNFAMAKYEVPQNLYEAVMDHNPSVWGGPRNSVEMVSWIDSMRFCAKCTMLLRQAELIGAEEVIRLPTEAEWEYCCRAGTTTAYSFGDDATKPGDAGKKASALDPYGWHTGNASGNDPPVGALKPNAWGLYDMHGYLWEYCLDAWHGNYQGGPADGSAWELQKQHGLRVMRSGSWRDHYDSLRSAVRWPTPDHTKSDAIGFRCVKARRQQR